MRIMYGRHISLCGTVLRSFRLLRFEVGKAWGGRRPRAKRGGSGGGAAAEPTSLALRPPKAAETENFLKENRI